MNISPRIAAKSLRECAPGELVRLAGSNPMLCLVAVGNEGQRFLIVLLNDKGQPFPTYHLISNNDDLLDQIVISYGSEYGIEVDHEKGWEFGAQNLTEVCGVLVFSSAGWFMLVAPRSFQLSSAYCNLHTGQLGGGPDRNLSRARFAKWRMVLDPADQFQRKVIFQLDHDASKDKR